MSRIFGQYPNLRQFLGAKMSWEPENFKRASKNLCDMLTSMTFFIEQLCKEDSKGNHEMAGNMHCVLLELDKRLGKYIDGDKECL